MLPSLAADDIPDRLFAGKTVPEQVLYPLTPQPDPEALVSPPGEERYFPVRSDGQACGLKLESTINMTESFNRFYYKPYWDGIVWAPTNLYTLVEKGSRVMATWPEYDEFGELRVLNNWHKFVERMSGFGP